MKIDHEFLSIGYIQKKSAVYAQKYGNFEYFFTDNGHSRSVFIIYTQNAGKSGGFVGILLQFLCHMPNLRYFNIL